MQTSLGLTGLTISPSSARMTPSPFTSEKEPPLVGHWKKTLATEGVAQIKSSKTAKPNSLNLFL
jgi:hypothetical protein